MLGADSPFVKLGRKKMGPYHRWLMKLADNPLSRTLPEGGVSTGNVGAGNP